MPTLGRATTDPQTRAEEGKEEKLKEFKQARDLQFVMAHKEGRDCMRKILEECGMNVDPRNMWSDNERKLYALLGARDVGKWLIREMLINCASSYKLMLNEQLDDAAKFYDQERRKRSEPKGEDIDEME